MTAPLWLPGATIIKALKDGGSMLGADAYVTWHTFECDYTVPAVNGARVLNSEGFAVHIVFHPITGDIVAMIPANRAGRGLLNEAGGVETNRQGRVNIQIEVIGRASRPWTKDLTAKGRAGLARILSWLDDLGVPRTAPNGPVGPTTYAASTKRARSVKAWNGPGGYFCHADVPENDHWDHGAIDMRDLWAVTAPTQSKEDDMPLTDADVAKFWGYKAPGEDKDAYEYLRNEVASKAADLAVQRLLGADVIPAPVKQDGNPTWTVGASLEWTGKGVVALQATVAILQTAVQSLAESKGADAAAITQAVVDKINGLQIELTPKES